MDPLALHLRRAVANTTLLADPGPHMIVSDLLSADTYTLLLETMPPAETFEVAESCQGELRSGRGRRDGSQTFARGVAVVP